MIYWLFVIVLIGNIIIMGMMNRKIVISSRKVPNSIYQIQSKQVKNPPLSIHAAKIVK
jgi:hypothetical protein